MTITLIDAQASAPQPWRNGGGRTRELLVWPAQGAWRLRISRADIEADGPFSPFAGVTRWFAVLSGAGVELAFEASKRSLRAGDGALCFNGSNAPGCRLLNGPTEDLNLMAAGGHSVMRRAVAGQPWDEPLAMRGLYTPVAGHWHAPPHRRLVPAHTLLWDDNPSGAWTFDPVAAAPCAAWWLGFTP